MKYVVAHALGNGGVRPHARAGVEISWEKLNSDMLLVRPHARAGVEMSTVALSMFACVTFALMRGRELKSTHGIEPGGAEQAFALMRGRELK